MVRNSSPIFASVPGQEPSFGTRTKQLSSGSIVLLITLGIQLGLACLFLFWLFDMAVLPSSIPVLSFPPSTATNTSSNGTRS